MAGKQARRAHTGLSDLEWPRIDRACECLSAPTEWGCYLLSGRLQQPLESQPPIPVVQADVSIPITHLSATDACSAQVCAGAAHALQTFRQSELVREAGPPLPILEPVPRSLTRSPTTTPRAPRFF
jgi:hypothetical protein